ncbi:ABC transporter permease subunit [Bacillus sp. CECT 9360]|uniref:ABC transporter permease subunit n=1 Tax=Bacillus sp. CECT 9360 TaxID=2845821 RepID=UPI001E363DB6|nr:ABC transporter permease subunit [Bacillus sp. CECT 9360]CAH0347470.1 hypothetical protein BCI9360_03870 [Bacillus sp. CECT 9360]
MEGFHHPFWLIATYQVIVMSLIALPSLTLHLSSIMKKSWDEEYVESSRVLGGSKFHILRKHIIPAVSDKVLLLFMQQFIQVLLLMAHLGVLKLFFGGTKVEEGTVSSISNEWSGLIGFSYQFLRAYPWIPLTPIIFFALTSIALVLILESIKKAQAIQSQMIK